MGRLTSLLLAVALLVGTPIAIAGEQGVTLFDVELKATPDAEASTVGKVPKNTQVEIIERRGAWSRVRALSKGQGEGWVSTYDVRLSGEAAQREQSGETGLGRFLGMLFGEPTQHGPQVTSTIGIREWMRRTLRRRNLIRKRSRNSTNTGATCNGLPGLLHPQTLSLSTWII